MRTRQYYSDASRGLPTQRTPPERRLSPVFRIYPDLRGRRIDFCCILLSKNFAGNFEQEFSKIILSGDTFIVMEKISKSIAGIIPIGPGRR